MFVLVESLLTKSKVLARQESLGKCSKVESRFYKRPIFERVAPRGGKRTAPFDHVYNVYIEI